MYLVARSKEGIKILSVINFDDVSRYVFRNCHTSIEDEEKHQRSQAEAREVLPVTGFADLKTRFAIIIISLRRKQKTLITVDLGIW